MRSINDGVSRPLLGVRGIRKTFGEIVAVADATLHVDRGEVLGFIGPNGAGKTTTIACALGLTSPTSGTIELLGSDPRDKANAGRPSVGYAAQETGLFGELSVADNLAFFLRLRRPDLNRKAARDACVDVVRSLALDELEARKGRTLSLGQQRLVHVAAGLVGDPSLVILDEPTAALDVYARDRVVAAVRRLAELGCGVLYSSHYLEEVEQLCDRVVVLAAGKVVASGSVPSVIDAAGGTEVVITARDRAVRVSGDDVGAALLAFGDVSSIVDVRVVRPDLSDVIRQAADVATGMARETNREVSA